MQWRIAMVFLILVMFGVSTMYLVLSAAITDYLNGVSETLPSWYYYAQWYLPTVNVSISVLDDASTVADRYQWVYVPALR